MNKKKVVIVGGGVSGMTAGIYLLDNGFDVEIYEKHVIPGGQCTGWIRENTHIDGCAHWIVGTNPKSDLYPLWKHVGVIDENSRIFETEYFDKFKYGDEIITMYADLDKLEPELIRVAPEDSKLIKHLIRLIKMYQHVRIPVTKPIDKMNPIELIRFSFGMIPTGIAMFTSKKKSAKDFSLKFKNPMLRRLIADLLDEDYNLHSFLYVMQALSLNNAGVIDGQSIGIATRMKKKFLDKGGKMFLNQTVKRINVENKVAKSIELASGQIIKADYIVGALDAHHLFYDLLENKYTEKYFISRFSDNKKYPLNTSVMLSYKVRINCTYLPKMLNVSCTPFDLGEKHIDRVSIRNNSFIKVENDGSSCMTILIPTGSTYYDQIKSMSKQEYLKHKQDLGELLRKTIIKTYKFDDQDIKFIDMSTPLTYERYTNAYRGSYMSFLDTKYSKGLMRKGSIKGLKNFCMAGQWIMPPGGLPIALFAGKHAAYRISMWANKKFIDVDKPKWGLILKKPQFNR